MTSDPQMRLMDSLLKVLQLLADKDRDVLESFALSALTSLKLMRQCEEARNDALRVRTLAWQAIERARTRGTMYRRSSS